MDEATRERTARAAKIVGEWRPSVFGAGSAALKSAAGELLDGLTPDDGCAPLLAFLWLPNVDQAQGIVDRVVEELARRPDAVEPLLRIRRAGYADGAEQADAVAAARADAVLWAMPLDDVVPALLRLACGDGDSSLREDALGRLSGRGPEVVAALERLTSDDELGRSAARCLAQLEEHDMVASGAAPDAIDELVYAYHEAPTDEDAEYALGQLAQALEDYQGVLGTKALAPVRAYIRECVERFMGAEDEEAEDVALDELEVFAGACGDPGARFAREEVARLPVTDGTHRLHEVADRLAPPSPPPAAPREDEDGGSPIVEAAATSRAAELQALTRSPGFRRTQGSILDLPRRPEFLRWHRPAGLPPLEDGTSHQGFIYLALSALCNDTDEELKAIAALSLLGDREAFPFLRLLEAEEDDPVVIEWTQRVIGWDAQLAEAEGVDLSTWAAAGPDDDEPGIDVLFPAARPRDAAAAGPMAESEEPAQKPAEPMEPPGLASMDEAFEEFVRRMEREQGG